jgi:hypothetical protein
VTVDRCRRSRPTTTCCRGLGRDHQEGRHRQAAVAAIDGGCRTLRLPTIRSRFGEIAAAAEREQLSYLGFLAELVMAECDDRDTAGRSGG